MDSPALTFKEVTMIGRPARVNTPLEDRSRFGEGVFREWMFEDGFVWLNYRDQQRTYSVRLAAASEVPTAGWHHSPGCDCRHCAAWRGQTLGVTRG
jgi:hypothetical protein